MAIQTVTLGKVQTLSNQERANGWTHKWTIDYTDINSASSTNGDDVNVTLGNTPANWLLSKAVAHVTTAFAGATTANYPTVSFGTDGDVDNFIAASDTTAQTTYIGAAGGAPATAAGSHGTAADVLLAQFLFDASSDPAELTAGSLDIYASIDELS